MADTEEKKYDELTAEEREVVDNEKRKKEAEEQATLPYKWKQTLQDVDVIIPVLKGTRGKNVVVTIKKKSLKVNLKGQDPIIEGDLCKDVKLDDCTWTLEDQEEIHIHLEKVNTMEWWENVVTSAPKIDTRLIQPENSKLSDLDGETRSMVEKMMFDQQQQQLGKPTSDDLKKKEILEKFQKQHPEMDFSNAKFS